MMTPNPLPPSLRQSGMSLVEIMVALLIGLVVTLVITQVMTTYEGQKRATAGTSDAQTTGALSLDSIQRESLMAGYGLNLLGVGGVGDNPLGCTNTTDFVPVRIIDGGTAAGASDRVIITYANTLTGGTPVGANTAAAMLACRVNGEEALVVDGTTCTRTTVARVAANNINAVNNPNGRQFSCLGQWSQVEFRVTGTDLERRETRAGVAQPVAPVGTDIVAFKAQYGIVAAATTNQTANQIVQWVPATGIWADGSITPNNRSRIKAFRIALVARNNQLEKEDVTAACSSTTAANPTGLCAWDATSANPATASPAPAIDLTNIANWKRYRYRVFETIVPLRNVIWANRRTLP